MDIVVRTERYHLQVWSYIMNYASLDTVHIESVLVHESHAAQQENSPSYGTKRLVTWRDEHLQDSLHQREDSNFFSHQQHVH